MPDRAGPDPAFTMKECTMTPFAIRSTLLAFATLAALSAGACQASVDTSPRPGGVYKLKPGIFVAEGSDCAAPANAAIRQYDGKGIATAHTRACRAVIKSRRGASFKVEQSCIDAGSGPAPRKTQRQTIAVRDALSFTQTIGAASTSFRYCPVDALPADLRKAAPR